MAETKKGTRDNTMKLGNTIMRHSEYDLKFKLKTQPLLRRAVCFPSVWDSITEVYNKFRLLRTYAFTTLRPY